ncbi:hypothetical protein M218_23015 [Burkholderia pseudomallei MSHR338]|nr:hypothetical protein M218_23015 [Burkholderia pseudomallei MSHR338]
MLAKAGDVLCIPLKLTKIVFVRCESQFPIEVQFFDIDFMWILVDLQNGS